MMTSKSTFNRRAAISALGAVTAFVAVSGKAAGTREATFEQAVDNLRVAMAEGDTKRLDAMLDEALTYMHSSGHSQTKANLMNDLGGKHFFASLTYTEKAFQLSGNTGIATLTVEQVKNIPGGKTRASRIKVMQVWVKSGHNWKLLARSSALLSSSHVAGCSAGDTAPPHITN